MYKCSAFLIAAFFIITGCGKSEKDPCKGLICEPIPLNLVVNFKDQHTGADLFFSNPPRYQVSAIHVSNPKDSALWNIYADTAHAITFLILPVGRDGDITLYIQVGNAKADTLQYTATHFTQGCCGYGVYTTHATLNGQPLNNNRLDTTRLIIKK